MVEKLVSDPFMKNQNWAYLWIEDVEDVIKFVFIVCSSRGLPKYIKIKVPSTCFYLI